MMREEECHPCRSVKMCIGHHLVDVGLGDALPGVLDPGADPLPFRVDDLHHCAAAPDQHIGAGLEQPLSVLRPSETVRAPALKADIQIGPRHGAADHAADVFLEQRPHVEQECRAAPFAHARRLVTAAQQQPRERKQVAPSMVRPVEDHLVPPQRPHRHRRDPIEDEGEFAQALLVGDAAGDAGQMRHAGLHDPVERDVLGQFVEAAGDAAGVHRMAGELHGDIEGAAQGPEVVGVSDIAARQAAAHRLGQPLAEQSDQDFEQCLALPVEIGHAQRAADFLHGLQPLIEEEQQDEGVAA